MEVWRPEVIEGQRPAVLSRTTLVQAAVLHVAAFLLIAVCGWLNGIFEPKEKIEVIDLTVIVNENLNGEENEPPPVKNPPPPAPKPKPQPKPKAEVKKIEPPKALEQIETNIVKKVEKKKKKDPPKKKEEPKKEEPKKEEPKKEEPPKKSKEELLKERMEKMRNSAVKNKTPVKIEVKNAKESGNGKTAKQNLSQAEIEKLLGQGYKAGTTNQIAKDEMSRCVSLIKMAISDKWDRLAPKVGNSGTVVLTCRLNSAGGLVNVRVTKSCGDKLSDQAALSVARSVSSIAGLSDGFITKHMKEDISIYYRVEGR